MSRIFLLAVVGLVAGLFINVTEGKGTKTKPKANAFMGLPYWIILPNKVGDPLLKGQKMYKSTCVAVDDYGGPKHMPAYNFPGNPNCYVRIESNGKLDFKKSFTIATFVKQNVTYDGPMVEWLGKSPFGTHFWIYVKKTFVNLMPHHYWHMTPKPGVWTFVGVSYDYQKGTVLMWTGKHTMIKQPGKFKADTSGKYVYVGLRPRQKNAFKGQLAGTTLLKGAIEKKDIAKLQGDIEKALGKPPKKMPPRTNPFMGLPHWIILPRKVDDKLLKGQKMYKPTCVQKISMGGPKHIPAYVFPGNPNCYVRIESNGKLDFKKSFTIATFVKQKAPYDGPMVEWLGKNPYGTHFWIFVKKTFVNLMPHHYWHMTPKSGVWTFVGVSYDYQKGTVLMWTGKHTMIKQPGKFKADTSGKYVYVGLRPRQKNAFKGQLAGTTLLKGAIEKKEIAKLRADIEKALGRKGCTDKHTSCSHWARKGLCRTNAKYMLPNCKMSCRQCPHDCKDKNKKCAQWAKIGHCQTNANYMLLNCKKSCKLCLQVSRTCEGHRGSLSCPKGTHITIISANYGRTNKNKCAKGKPASKVTKTDCKHQKISLAKVKSNCERKSFCILLAANSVFGDPCCGTYKYLDVNYICELGCQDKHKQCAYFAKTGKCKTNPNYMLPKCRRSCRQCPHDCQDRDRKCAKWARNGDCQKNPNYVLPNCRKSCKQCIQVSKTCGNHKRTLTCPKGTVIKILFANYGRTNSTICKGTNSKNTKCKHQKVSLSKVRKTCDGKPSCMLSATNAVFGDPCVGTYKYLDVAYSCELAGCQDMHTRCSIWANSGFCTRYRKFMKDICPKSCKK